MTTEKNRGKYTGIFVAFLAMGHFVGNGLTAILQLFPGFSFPLLFFIFTILSLVGTISFFAIQASPRSQEKVSLRNALIETMKIFPDSDAILLWPGVISYGMNLAYIFGSFPSKINDTLLSSSSLTLFGAVHTIISVFGGRTTSWMNGNFLPVVSAVGTILGILIASVASDNTWWLYPIAGALLGTMESGYLIQLLTIFGTDFPDRLTPVNSAFRFLSASMVAIMFFLSVVTPYWIMVIITIVTEIIGLALLIFRSIKKKNMMQFTKLPPSEISLTQPKPSGRQ